VKQLVIWPPDLLLESIGGLLSSPIILILFLFEKISLSWAPIAQGDALTLGVLLELTKWGGFLVVLFGVVILIVFETIWMLFRKIQSFRHLFSNSIIFILLMFFYYLLLSAAVYFFFTLILPMQEQPAEISGGYLLWNCI